MGMTKDQQQMMELQESIDETASNLVKLSTRLALLGQAIGAVWNEEAHEWQHAEEGPMFESEEAEVDFLNMAMEQMNNRMEEINAIQAEATNS